MPRSVYWPLRHMSHSPTAQFGHGTGSGRRTMPTTRSPFVSPPAGPGSTTRPSDSWPNTRRVLPGGAQPYFPSTISTSVPQTPTAMAPTRTAPSRMSGSGTSSNCADPAFFGSTVMACMRHPSPGFGASRGSAGPVCLDSMGTHCEHEPEPIEPYRRQLGAKLAALGDNTFRLGFIMQSVLSQICWISSKARRASTSLMSSRTRYP